MSYTHGKVLVAEEGVNIFGAGIIADGALTLPDGDVPVFMGMDLAEIGAAWDFVREGSQIFAKMRLNGVDQEDLVDYGVTFKMLNLEMHEWAGITFLTKAVIVGLHILPDMPYEMRILRD